MRRMKDIKELVLYMLNRLLWLVIIGVCTNVLYVLLFMWLEHRSFGDSTWWAWVTGFTVGYGDISPVTIPGRLVAMAAMATDCLLLICFAGQVTAMVIINKHIFSDAEQELSKHRDSTGEQIARAQLASSYRIEEALGCLPKKLPVIPPFKTDEEIMALVAERAEGRPS